MFGEKEELREQLTELQSWRDQLMPFLDTAIAIRTEVAEILGTPLAEQGAMDIAMARVKDRMVADGREELIARFEGQVYDEAHAEALVALEAEAPSIKEQVRAEFMESDDANRAREQARQEKTTEIREEVEAEERQKIREQVEADQATIREEIAAAYRASDRAGRDKQEITDELRKKLKDATIDEILEQVRGEEARRLLEERAKEILEAERQLGRINDIRIKAHTQRMISLADFEKGDILFVYFGTYTYSNKERKMTSKRTLKLSVHDPSTGTCVLVDDSLKNSEDPYIVHSGLEDGACIRLGFVMKHGGSQELVPELHEGMQAAYQIDGEPEAQVDPLEVCGLGIVSHGVDTMLLSKSAGTELKLD